jgi:hypothetical protein
MKSDGWFLFMTKGERSHEKRIEDISDSRQVLPSYSASDVPGTDELAALIAFFSLLHRWNTRGNENVN